MATWKDGPRYAPATPPAGFAEPVSAVSLAAPPPSPAPPPPPGAAPEAFQEPDRAVPLEMVGSAPRETRNATQPFTVASMLLTEDGQPRGEKSPYAPFEVATLEAPVKSAWAPPPPDARPVRPVVPVSLGQAVQAAYPPMIITLVVAAFVGTTWPLWSVLWLFGASFLWVRRVGYRVQQVRWAFWGIAGVLGILLVIETWMSRSTYNVDMRMGLWTMIGCLVAAVAVVVLQWRGLRYQEPPNPRR